ncbi:MAG: RNA-binding protein [Planctomycetes bacterium]|nr:RNA-binding protein [Planctomycetota bacterium]
MGTRLYVGNLSYDTLDDDLRTLFADNGAVVSCEVMIDRQTGRSKGFAFVEMGSQDEANKAIESCNGKSFQGRELNVNEARARAERPAQPFFGGGGGGGGSFGGGGSGARRPVKSKGSRRNARNQKRSRKSFF